MGKSNSSFWCPTGKCGKKVVGLTATDLHPVKCLDGKRFVCWNCEKLYSAQELEDYGNNLNRVYRQQRNNKVKFIPHLTAGTSNEW